MVLADSVGSNFTLSNLLPYIIAAAAIFLANLLRQRSFDKGCPPKTSRDWPIFGDLRFWSARHDFWDAAVAASKTRNFSFHVGPRHRVIGTDSNEGKDLYFGSKDLNFSEGYAILFGKGFDFSADNMASWYHMFNQRLTQLVKREQLNRGLPALIADVRGRLDELARDERGLTDPFDSIYKLVYLLTQRTVGAIEIARDRALLDKTLGLYEAIEKSSTPSQVMFPWLPTPALIKRFWSGTRMYLIFSKIIKARAAGGHREDDPLQYLIDSGEPVDSIVPFVLGALLAGQLNSGINAAWVLCYLAADPYWQNEVRKEVQAVVEKWCPGDEPFIERLSKLPIEAWEQDFPLIDNCLKDSIRLQAHGTGYRKNTTGKPLQLGTEVIPVDGFLLYHIGRGHLNPEWYPNPHQWDPARYSPERAEDKKDKYAWVGWGLGRHPCLGMKFAKLENILITSFFCTMFDFSLAHADGSLMKETSKVDTNKNSACKPDVPMYIKYSVRQHVFKLSK